MLWIGSIIFFISLILGFKFEMFWYLAMAIVVAYIFFVPYYFVYLKTCRNCGAKNPPHSKKCKCCGEEDWRQR